MLLIFPVREMRPSNLRPNSVEHRHKGNGPNTTRGLPHQDDDVSEELYRPYTRCFHQVQYGCNLLIAVWRKVPSPPHVNEVLPREPDLRRCRQKWQWCNKATKSSNFCGPTADGLRGSFEEALEGGSKGRFASKDQRKGPRGRSEGKLSPEHRILGWICIACVIS